MAAGVAETSDLGSPSVADAPSTRFTVATTTETYVREVYALREAPDGSGLVTLAQNAVNGTWSADGRKVLFESSRSGDADLYTVNADGPSTRSIREAPVRSAA